MEGSPLNRRTFVSVVSSVGIAVLMAACTAQTNPKSASSSSSDGQVKTVKVSYDPNTHEVLPSTDLSSWCGDKKIKLGLADGAAENSWRTTALAVVKKEAALCPAVDKQILYTNAGGDQQKAISDINSMVAQGVNVLIVYPDFGPAQLPAIRAAMKAGVKVVPYSAAVGGTPGVDYTATTVFDGFGAGQTYGDMVGKYLKTGNVVVLGGIPGAPTSLLTLNGVKDALKNYPGIKLLVDQPVVTNWTKVDAQKAVTGLIAKYPKIDAVFTDYGVTAVATINAFTAAGKRVPAIASFSTNNELGCLWKKASTGAGKFPVFSVDSTPAMALLAVQQGVAAANGKSYNPLQAFQPPIFDDSPAAKNPPCDPTLPPDADLTSPLTQAELTAILH
jgi:ribose transport system substrate-binding protein